MPPSPKNLGSIVGTGRQERREHWQVRSGAAMVSGQMRQDTKADRQIALLLARGDREICAGSDDDLDTVLAEADRLLTDK